MAKERTSSSLFDRIAGGGKKAPVAKAATTTVAPTTVATAKAAPAPAAPTQVELPGTELAAMADRQEGLLERVMNARDLPDPTAAASDLAALHGVLVGLSQKTVIVIFAMGKVLSDVKESLEHGEFIPWIEANCPFHRATAFRYMQVYDRYRDEPRRALEELSITEAYLEAGVKKLAAPDPGEQPREKGPRLYDVSQWKDWKRVFTTPPISGVVLKRHRVVPYEDGRLYVVREETGPVPAVELLADFSVTEPSYQVALQEVHQNLQMALEVFYSKVEEFEDKGLIGRPFDSSRPAMAARMRNITPDATAKPKAPKKPVKAGKRGSR